jgi:hypothetical protein
LNRSAAVTGSTRNIHENHELIGGCPQQDGVKAALFLQPMVGSPILPAVGQL